MNTITNTIHIGASSEFEIIHISDTHLTFADFRDDERKNELSRRRINGFQNANDNIRQIISVSNEQNLPVMCTGDLIDFVSYLNLDEVLKITSSANFFTCAGNHEFSLYVGEAWEDDAYKNYSLSRVQKAFTNDIIFSSKVINGVNFVALDNSYYLISSHLLDLLKNEVEKDLPIVLMLHVPLFTQELFDNQMIKLKCADAGLMAAPENLISSYSDYRFRQQNADFETKEAYDYIISTPQIKIILTGHLHYDFETTLPTGKLQLLTGTDTMRKIRFI